MMMKKLTAWLLVLLAVATAAADRLPASPSIDDLGNLTVGKLALHWTRYAPDWRSETLQADDFKADAGFPRRSPGRVEISGKWNSFRIAISAVAAATRHRMTSPLTYHRPTARYRRKNRSDYRSKVSLPLLSASVERRLQNHHRRLLVDHRTVLASADARIEQLMMCGHCRQTLIHQFNGGNPRHRI